MSNAFRCDGCDRFFGGRPAATLKVTPNYGTIGTPLVLGHASGVNDAHPRKDLTEEVEWPFHRTEVQFCVVCAARHVIPGVQEAAENGRYTDE